MYTSSIFLFSGPFSSFIVSISLCLTFSHIHFSLFSADVKKLIHNFHSYDCFLETWLILNLELGEGDGWGWGGERGGVSQLGKAGVEKTKHGLHPASCWWFISILVSCLWPLLFWEAALAKFRWQFETVGYPVRGITMQQLPWGFVYPPAFLEPGILLLAVGTLLLSCGILYNAYFFPNTFPFLLCSPPQFVFPSSSNC